MFYDKEIQILGETEGYLDDARIWHDDEDSEKPVLKTIKGDVQPYEAKLIYREFNYEEEITKKVYCDIEDLIDVGVILKIDNEEYKVKKVVKWDDYMEVGIDNA